MTLRHLCSNLQPRHKYHYSLAMIARCVYFNNEPTQRKNPLAQWRDVGLRFEELVSQCFNFLPQKLELDPRLLFLQHILCVGATENCPFYVTKGPQMAQIFVNIFWDNIGGVLIAWCYSLEVRWLLRRNYRLALWETCFYIAIYLWIESKLLST